MRLIFYFFFTFCFLQIILVKDFKIFSIKKVRCLEDQMDIDDWLKNSDNLIRFMMVL